jgi:hypothetical protein
MLLNKEGALFTKATIASSSEIIEAAIIGHIPMIQKEV